ncbi:Interleukin-18 [Trichinella pseudospiralis]
MITSAKAHVTVNAERFASTTYLLILLLQLLYFLFTEACLFAFYLFNSARAHCSCSVLLLLLILFLFTVDKYQNIFENLRVVNRSLTQN